VNSSTFNSRSNIWAAIAIAAVILVGYELALRSGKVPSGKGLDQGQTNTIELERLVFGDRPPSMVFLGSSLTENLPVQMIDPRASNVGLGGSDALTGLEALSRLKLRPRVVFIEMSQALLKGRDDKTLNQFFNPTTKFLVGHVHELRQQYQPLNVLLTPLRDHGEVRGGRELISISKDVRDAAVGRVEQQFSVPLTPPESVALDRAFDEIAEGITDLQDGGVKVVLMFIPGEPSVQSEPKITAIKSRAMERFPADRYLWIPSLPLSGWKTNDGIHIVPEDAKRFVAYLKDECATLNLLPTG
jgi:hypothetical protein